MSAIKEYVSTLEETCGEERHFVATLRHGKRDEAIRRILQKGQVDRSISGLVLDISFRGTSLRLYRTGKVLMKGPKNKEEAERVLEDLLG
ncbi:MAG: hypothetical protein QXW19_00855 [Candidatus Bathyarchaeia archaeon]